MISTSSLNWIDFAALAPLLTLLFGTLLLLLLEICVPKWLKQGGFILTTAILLIALIGAFLAPKSESPLLMPWLSFDSLSRIFTILFLIIGLGSTLLSHTFFQYFHTHPSEYYFLLLSALFGLILIGFSADFLTLFIGLETLSISLYILVGYMKKWSTSSEAAIKYFFLGSLGAAILLYGIALIYGAVGFTHFQGLSAASQELAQGAHRTLFLAGIALVTVGLCFKAAIVPFHAWAPDVYDGASTPLTSFMAIAVKAGAMAALTRVFLVALPNFDATWNQTLCFFAYATLIYANYVAMQQTLLRRFFAYSGISHAGFLLIPFIASSEDSLLALLFYLVIYALATFGCFAVLTLLDRRISGVTLQDLRGLFHRSPFLAGVFALCLLNLAGIPPTVGFFAKFFLFKIAFGAGYYTLVIIALLTTILSANYYLRLIALMFAEVSLEKEPIHNSWPTRFVAIVSLAALVFLSIYPDSLSFLLKLNTN